MGRIDIVCGLITAAVSVLFYVGTLSFPDMNIGINPKAYPMVVIVALFGFSVLLIVQGAMKSRKEAINADTHSLKAAARTLPRGKTAWFLLALAAAMFAYVFLLEPLGFILVTPPLIALAMVFFGERKPIKIILVSAISAAVLYFVFRGLFRVPLPRSFLW
ncbi:MAG TPA: tripartite tricarboxylate transporter TctB family protein [Rectinemataceae bacterium]